MMPLFPSEPKPRHAARAPLFDRLCGSTMWLDEGDVRHSIANELRRIMSARSMPEEWRKNPKRGTRVMGWDELLTRDPQSDKFIIEREMTRRIARLEPRLHAVTVELIKHSHRRYFVRIHGEFRVTPQHPPSSFATTVEYIPSAGA